jgi:hypothetical protein
MVARMIDEADMMMRTADKPYGKVSQWAKDLVSSSKDSNFVTNKVANAIDWVVNSEEKAYAKAVYKKLADKGYDLKTIPYDQQLDFVKKIPQEVLGVADNYAKTITRYGTGTSPLQNTLNTIWFPLLFHLKVAKFAAVGALKHPAMTAAIVDYVNLANQAALTPQGQQWHRTPGFGQFLLHTAGYAEPINIPALTGRTETPGQTAQRFTNVYNPLSPILQGAADVSGKQIPGTQAPVSKFEIQHPILNAIFGATGTSYAAVPLLEKMGAVSGQTGTSQVPTLKSIKKEMVRQSRGLPPTNQSLLTSLRDFAGGQKVSDTKKFEYARMRASYDFPDDQTKQNKEVDLIMRLWKRVKAPKQ